MNIPPRNHLAGCALVLLIALLAGCKERPEEFVASGRDYIARQEYQAATIQLKNALQAKPDYAEARYLLGVSLLKVNDFASAEKELRRARELKYLPEKTLPALAEALLSQGKAIEVSSQFETTTLSDPRSDAQLRVQVGNAFLSLNQLDRAQESFNRAIVESPERTEVRVGQARLSALRGNLQEAERLVDEVLVTFPREIEAMSLKADLALFRGDTGRGLDELRRLVQLAPTINNRYRISRMLLWKGQDDEAAKQIDAMRTISANDPRTLHVQSVIEFRRGNIGAARGFVLELLKNQPEFVPALLLAAAIGLQSESYNQVRDYCQRAITLTGDQPSNQRYARTLLATAYLRTGDISLAAQTVDEALKRAPDDTRLLMLAGEVALARNQAAHAANYYEKASKLDAQNVGIANRLAQLRFVEGEDAQAIQALENSSGADEQQYQSDLMLALYYLRRGEEKKAMLWIDSIERKRPDNPIGPGLRGAMLADKKDLTAARKQFERALELEETFVPVLDALARLDTIEKTPDAARQRFEAVLTKKPKAEAVALAYARYLQSQEASFEKIERVLQNVIRNEQGAVRARLALIAAYSNMNYSVKALTAAQEALASAPDNPAFVEVMGRVQHSAKQYQEAATSFERLVTLRPEDPRALLLLGDAYFAASDKDRALNAIQKALRIKPDLLPAQVALIRLYMAESRPNEALATARQIEKQRPKEAVGYQNEANLLYGMSRWNEAVTVLEKGLRMTSSWRLVPRLHATLLQLGRQTDADALVSKWLLSHPKDVEVRAYLAQRALESKDYILATRIYRELLTIQPAMPFLLNNLAWASYQASDPKALEYAEQANRLLPNQGPILDTLGWILVERGDVVRGVGLLQKAAELMPRTPSVRVHFAKALVRAGQKDEARKQIEYLTNSVNDAQLRPQILELAKQL